MRRVRQTSQGVPPAISSRGAAAIALSAALHVLLIYGVKLPVGSGQVRQPMVFDARLIPAPVRASSVHDHTDKRNTAHRAAALPAIVLAPPLPAPVAVEEPFVAIQVLEPTQPPARAVEVAAPSATLVDPVHYPARELDVYPQALRPITPSYPTAALDAQSAGSVTLLVLIDETGRVTGTSVMDAAPDGLFEQAAQEALEKAAFYPAQKEGHVVRSQIVVKVEFDANDASAER